MKLVLDTHVVLWALGAPERLTEDARTAIVSHDNQVLVSVVSLWEIVIKIRVQKLIADIAQIERETTTLGFGQLPIASAHLSVLAGLPRHHGDPFDHLLVAQAISEDATFVSDDRAIRRYPVRILGRS